MHMASFSSSSSSSSTHLSEALAEAIAAAERKAHSYSFIVPTDDEEAIPPAPITPLPRHNKPKRKVSQFFDETTAPTEIPSVSTALSLGVAAPPTFNHTKTTALAPTMNININMPPSSFPLSSPQLSHAQFDKDKGNKMPQFFDFLASESEGKLAVETTTLPTHETGVSTDLSLFHFAGPPKKTELIVSPRYSPPTPPPPPRGAVVVPALPEDRWDIKKVLTKSDVDDSSRLLLAKVDVHEHILPHVVGNGRGLDEGQGVEVAVWDMDMGSEHALVLQKWKTGSFVLKKNWMSEFVRRRGLEKNDEIGLRWDDENSRLEFTVLKKN